MRKYLAMAFFLVIGLFLMTGCGSDDSTSPPPVARIPVVAQLTDNASFESNPNISPDGQWILFESDVAGNMDIYRIPAEGGTAEQLTTDPAFDSAAEWSPDGQAIVFESERSGVKDIFYLDLSSPGAEPVALTSSESNDGSPNWSPNNDFIVFESARDKNGGSDIWLVPMGGEFPSD